VSLDRRREKRHLLPMVSTQRWDRSENLRRGVVFIFAICSLGAVGNWYNWLHGIGSLSLPIGLTIGAAIALTLTPRKWGLLAMSAGGTLGLEILAIVLRKGPLRPLLEAMVVTLAVFVLCEYVAIKIEKARPENGDQSASLKSG